MLGVAAALVAWAMQSALDVDAHIRFGARESVEKGSLSPDGTKFAFQGPLKGQGSALYIVPVDGSQPARMVVTADGSPERLDRCRWVSNARLVCQIYGVTQIAETSPHIKEGSPARNAERIKVPVPMFHGTYDRNVDVAHARDMAGELRGAGSKVDLVIYDQRDHYLEDSEVRVEMLEKSNQFLRTSLGL
jgi:pimeloyl-ACP methyl ester carboxylesterase